MENQMLFSKIKRSKMMFISSLIFVIAQQIYFPQAEKYFHLAVIFIYMIFLDMLSHEARNFKNEQLFAGTVLTCSIVSIAEKLMHVKLAPIYLLFLIGANIFALNLIFKIYHFIKTGQVQSISESHRKIFDKKLTFIKIILIGAALILMLAIGFAIFRMIWR